MPFPLVLQPRCGLDGVSVVQLARTAAQVIVAGSLEVTKHMDGSNKEPRHLSGIFSDNRSGQGLDWTVLLSLPDARGQGRKE